MKVLLDTHILIWMHSSLSKLPETAKAILNNPDNDVFYSSVSIWESQIKHVLHPDYYTISGKILNNLSVQSGLTCLLLRPEHAAVLEFLRYDYENAPRPHKDPFDRMLICQAKSEGMFLLTHDSLLPYYNESCVLNV